MKINFFFTKTPKLKRRFSLKIFFIFFLFNIFLFLNPSSLNACESPELLSIFLENLMIRDAGLYTLLGSKPMTLFDITCSVEETEEDIAQSYERTLQYYALSKQNPEKYPVSKELPDYEEFKMICLSRRKTHQFLNRKRLWQAWVAEKGTCANLTYILTSRKVRDEPMGLFINIPSTLYILKKYRTEFVELTGIQFDLATILESIEDENSFFWEKVCENHYLLGLLLGYGEKNAYLFDWVRTKSLSLASVSTLRFPELSRLNCYTKQILKRKVSIEELPIPYFVSFEINDEKIECYLKEREKIISFLKDKDFTSFVLRCLLNNCSPHFRRQDIVEKALFGRNCE